MTSTSPTRTTFDVDALRAGIQQRDAVALAALYAPTASVEVVDADHGPSRPLTVSGGEAIAAHLSDVYARDMEHRVELAAATDVALGYTVRCAYPDGTLVRCVSMAELRDGRIVHEVIAQAWDH